MIDVAKRITTYIGELIKKHPSETICVFSHGTVIATLLTQLFNAPLEEYNKWRPANGALTILEATGGEVKLIVKNEGFLE